MRTMVCEPFQAAGASLVRRLSRQEDRHLWPLAGEGSARRSTCVGLGHRLCLWRALDGLHHRIESVVSVPARHHTFRKEGSVLLEAVSTNSFHPKRPQTFRHRLGNELVQFSCVSLCPAYFGHARISSNQLICRGLPQTRVYGIRVAGSVRGKINRRNCVRPIRAAL